MFPIFEQMTEGVWEFFSNSLIFVVSADELQVSYHKKSEEGNFGFNMTFQNSRAFVVVQQEEESFITSIVISLPKITWTFYKNIHFLCPNLLFKNHESFPMVLLDLPSRTYKVKKVELGKKIEDYDGILWKDEKVETESFGKRHVYIKMNYSVCSSR